MDVQKNKQTKNKKKQDLLSVSHWLNKEAIKE